MPDLIAFAKQYLMQRATAYRLVFGSIDLPHTRRVMADLARYCRATRSTAHADPLVTARLNGRREVWLHIQEHLNLSTDDLYKLYRGPEKNAPD